MLSRKCPNCKANIRFNERLILILKENMECPNCKSIIMSTIIGGSMGVPFGALAWYWVDNSLQSAGISSYISISIGFLVCMFIVRLGYPFGPITCFNKNDRF